MARYIDADKIHEFVDTKVAEGKDGWAKGVPYEWAYALTVIDMQPTSDVVPKSEVKETVEKLMSATDKVICEAKQEVAREIFGELDKLLDRYLNDGNYTSGEMIYDFYELKNKYTEGGNE